ncbi:MAG TPA: MSMEG_4193 family putative phosphomutase [Candidatus Limnocylindrales bacterium]|nr:MSMEG_4193 family putative phosphomutase [Candidatus Limnocylindrales bacterium]
MTTVLFIRHGLTALTGPILTGWTPGIHLDERGQKQAAAIAARLRPVPLAAIVSSPLERCLDTAHALAAGREPAPLREIDERVGEVRYGEWTGGELKVLVKDPLWATVQAHPSAVTFPGGEALRDTQARAVAAVRDWNGRLGSDAVYAVVSHADVIKAILADALGLHLDQFQRIVIGPASLSVVRYTRLRPYVLRVNDQAGDPLDLIETKKKARRRSKPAATEAGA